MSDGMDITFFRGSMPGGEGRGGGNLNSYGSGDRAVLLSLQTSYCSTNKQEISEKLWHELPGVSALQSHKTGGNKHTQCPPMSAIVVLNANAATLQQTVTELYK